MVAVAAAAVAAGELLLEVKGDVLTLAVLELFCGDLDRNFCFISSVVKGAPVLRNPELPELSELAVDSDEAPRPVDAWTSEEGLRL